MAAWEMAYNEVKCNFHANLGLYYSAKHHFHIRFFGQKCYTITVDMILIN